MNIAVIDIGTSSMRCIVYDQYGKVLTQNQEKYHPEYRTSECVEQSADSFLKALLGVMQQSSVDEDCSQRKIDLIAVTSQRSAIVPLDKKNEPLMPFIMWQDKRNAKLCEALSGHDSVIFERSGAKVNTVFSGSKMAWIKREAPEIAEQTVHFSNVPEYLIYRMTGVLATDHTYGSRSNLMNLREKTWDPVLLDLFGVNREELAPLVPPGSVIGRVTSEFAGLSGLMEGTPVISAGGDQQCASVGQGVIREGILSVNTGTGAYLMSLCSQVPENLDENIICNCAALAGRYTLETNVLTCASAFDWYVRNFYREIQNLDEVNKELEQIYEQECEEIVLPFFQGRSQGGWNPEAAASFQHITLSSTRESMLKSLLEGIFLEVGAGIRRMENIRPVEQIYISGGMTRSRIMNQMQADIYGKPLVHWKNTEATATGALAVTLISQGICSSAEEAMKMLQGEVESVYTSNLQKAEHYQKMRNWTEDYYGRLYS